MASKTETRNQLGSCLSMEEARMVLHMKTPSSIPGAHHQQPFETATTDSMRPGCNSPAISTTATVLSNVRSGGKGWRRTTFAKSTPMSPALASWGCFRSGSRSVSGERSCHGVLGVKCNDAAGSAYDSRKNPCLQQCAGVRGELSLATPGGSVALLCWVKLEVETERHVLLCRG